MNPSVNELESARDAPAPVAGDIDNNAGEFRFVETYKALERLANSKRKIKSKMLKTEEASFLAWLSRGTSHEVDHIQKVLKTRHTIHLVESLRQRFLVQYKVHQTHESMRVKRKNERKAKTLKTKQRRELRAKHDAHAEKAESERVRRALILEEKQEEEYAQKLAHETNVSVDDARKTLRHEYRGKKGQRLRAKLASLPPVQLGQSKAKQEGSSEQSGEKDPSSKSGKGKAKHNPKKSKRQHNKQVKVRKALIAESGRAIGRSSGTMASALGRKNRAALPAWGGRADGSYGGKRGG